MRSVNGEAVTHFTRGLELAAKLPPGREQMRQELRLLLALGPTLQTTRGFGGPEVESTYTRARQLCEQVGEPAELFQALWGLWLYTTGGRGDYEAGRRIAEELVAIGERLGDRALRLEAHHAMCPSTLWVGEPETARRHCEQGIALYDREQHRSLAFLYGGHDPGVCCRMHSAMALWILGYPALALERSRAGVALSRDLDHLGSIVNALPFATMVHQLIGDIATLRELADSMVALSTEHGFRQWLAFGRIVESWIMAEQGRVDEAIARIRRDIGEYCAMGTSLWLPCFQGLLADACLKRGRTVEGLETVTEALVIADATGSRLWVPEFQRLRGELLLASGRGAEPDAEAEFRQAIEMARGQSAKSWELRSALSLSRLWQRQGKREEAGRLLTEVHGRFTEGFDTADLKAARTLLDELSP
jgi:predicted ATPase